MKNNPQGLKPSRQTWQDLKKIKTKNKKQKIKTYNVIPQNLYPRIKVILISRINKICNFIGKYRFNVKDGGN
jgi:hypothetical protein